MQLGRGAQAIAYGPPPPPGALASPGRPTHPPTHFRKIFLWQKMKFIELIKLINLLIKGAGNLSPILGTQTFCWPLTPPLPGSP